jgi:tetratricopeptide (TPR) repeat protein
MRAVVGLNPETPEGKVADLVNAIDLRRSIIDKNKLSRVALDNPDKPLLLWMAAVHCRTLKLNESGVFLYGLLLTRLSPHPGPVLVHQTYANLLDEVGRYEDALRERELAVKMEPAAWSYQGMANTLTNLGRFEEADRAFARATEIAPHRALYWETWGQSQMKWGHLDDGILKAKAALRLDPSRCLSWNLWGQCLEKKGDLEAAVEKYRVAIRVAPTKGWAYQAAAKALWQLNRRDESYEMRQAWQRVAAARDGRRLDTYVGTGKE